MLVNPRSGVGFNTIGGPRGPGGRAKYQGWPGGGPGVSHSNGLLCRNLKVVSLPQHNLLLTFTNR